LSALHRIAASTTLATATLCTFTFKSVRAHIVFQLLHCLFFPVSLWTSIFAAQQRLMKEQLAAPDTSMFIAYFIRRKKNIIHGSNEYHYYTP
jgi:hypothetical protein